MEIGWILALVWLEGIFLLGCRSDSEVQRTDPMENKWSIYYEFLKTFTQLPSENGKCLKQVQKIVDAIDQGDLWGLKALDASGSISSSFIYHQNFWHGSKQACELLNVEERPWMSPGYNAKVVSARAPFKMKYFTVFANYSTNSQFPQYTHIYVPFQLGLCAPEACMREQILEATKPVLESRRLPFLQLYNVTFEVLAVKTGSLENFFARDYTAISLLGIVAVVAFVLAMNLLQVDSGSTWGRFAGCFNLRRNLQELMNSSRPKGSIECLDGIKSLTCFWIMLAHLPYFSLFIYENAAMLPYIIKDFRISFLFIATFALDIFFVVSALLLTYNFLNNEGQKEAINYNSFVENFTLFAKLWLHRYLRLTPAFLFAMVLSHLSAVYMEEATHLHVPGTLDNYCPQYSWWRGLLYVHSFYPMEEMCGFWTWYLSCEMLYYSASLLGLFVFTKSPNRVRVYFLWLLGLSIIYSFYVNYSEHFEIGLDKFYSIRNTIYIAPLVRMSPYLVGISGGYYLHSVKDSPLKINRLIRLSWATVGLLGIVLFTRATKYVEGIPAVSMQIVNSIGRFVLAIFVVGAIVILTFEEGGAPRSMLCSGILVHFSKMSYMMYLLQPILVFAYRAGSESAVRMDVFNIYIEGLGIIAVCYFVSFLATLFFEIPYFRLSSEFLKTRKKENKKK